MLRIFDAKSLEAAHNRFVDVNAGNAEGPEKISFAAFVDPEPGEQAVGVR